MYPTLTLGPFVLPTAGLIYVLGAWLALNVLERSAKALFLEAEATVNVGLTAVVFALVGGRLTFIALHWSAYQSHPLGMIWPLNTGYDLWGALLFGSGAAFFYGRYRQLPAASLLDALAPSVLIGLTAVALADLLAGPGYGTLSNVPWAMSQFGVRRHPVQIYEMLTALVGLVVWWRSLDHRDYDGQVFLLVVAWVSAGRLLVDAFRAEPWVLPNGIHVIQMLSFVALLAALFGLARQADNSLP